MRLLYVPGLLLAVANAGFSQGPTPNPTPGGIREEVTVTAARVETRLGETPASVAVVGRPSIESAGGNSLDDILRQTVGFSIFRRSAGRFANPTTQGVSLRGVGASGASRTAVFFDGVPINDPFGGWVQWNRVSPLEVERVEVLRGGASSLYGDAGLSGAINIFPRSVTEKWAFAIDASAGTQRSGSAAVFAGGATGDWTIDTNASGLQTKGYKPVDADARGPVDAYSGVRATALSVRMTRAVGSRASIFLSPSIFGEVRTNGTGLQTNRTHIRHAAAGGSVRSVNAASELTWRAFASGQVYDQVFSTVNADRTTEALNRVQRVPAASSGGSLLIRTTVRGHTLLGGFEMRNVHGASDEIAFASGLPSVLTGSGGRQSVLSLFGQDLVRVGRRAVVGASVRYDRWRNYRAVTLSRTLATGSAGSVEFANREEDALSPQGSVLYHLSKRFSAYGNASRNFRSPTLNELYRPFRVGNVLTAANENLRGERSTNVEGGVAASFSWLSLRSNAFVSALSQTISNVTISAAPMLITRQRQNAGSTRAGGIEFEADLRIGRLHLTSGYMYVRSKVREFPSNPTLIGLFLPQVPRHQMTLQASFSAAKWTLALQARAAGEQFDDDLNTFRLEPYVQWDGHVSRVVGTRSRIYVALENVLNKRYSVGRTPIRTVSQPFGLRAGLRWN